MTYICIWPDLLCYLFYWVCVCGENNTDGLIFILGGEGIISLHLIAAEDEGMSYFQCLPTVKCEER